MKYNYYPINNSNLLNFMPILTMPDKPRAGQEKPKSHPLHPSDAKAKVVQKHMQKVLPAIDQKQEVSLPDGFGIGMQNRAGFQIDTPFGGEYTGVWIKTGEEVPQEIAKTKTINETNYPGISKLFNMPLFVDPDGQYLTFPLRLGNELQMLRNEELEPGQLEAIEKEIISKVKALHVMGLELTDTKIGMGSNVVINKETQQGQLTTFIDLATLNESKDSKEMLNAKQASTEISYLLSRYTNYDITDTEPNMYLNNVTARTSRFLTGLMDEESTEVFFDELAGSMQIDSFVPPEVTAQILQTFRTGFTPANFATVHHLIYEADKIADAEFMAKLMSQDNN
jgi:hypothetical protein